MILNAIPADTTPEAAWMQVQVFRRMPARRRLELALQWSDVVRNITADGVRSRHPHWSEDQIKRETIRLSIGDELFKLAYSPERQP